ncbi:MAG: DUF2182 domain-containing protein [Gemmatimonadetes bacterium]|nr:DUF2182 domain-containing protein [Gemmatimonadota bacterium]MYI06559.1 DUF2182 domain-containing protein [Gemmatimonadota bacterium]
MSYPAALGMWLAMTAIMMGPVVYPWLRALWRIEAASVIPFAGGYMLAWAGFSAAAAGVHVGLAALSLPVPFAMDAPVLSATALGLAGAFQFTALKEACLSHCRSPAGFLLTRWRPGAGAAARLGIEHGLYCVGCCWALMALALAVGMINLVWMGLLMAVMVSEAVLPFGARLTRPVGVALLALAAAILILHA